MTGPRKGRAQNPPIARGPGLTGLQPSIHLLERFTESDLATWERRSRELDEVHHELYHGLEPERIKRREEIIGALQKAKAVPVKFENYVRMVPYQYSLSPLSAAGSLRGIGGRFSIGIDCDEAKAAKVFPALYIGDSPETAFREYYQITREELEATGLTAAELSLRRSDSSVRLQGQLENVLDISNLANLRAVAKVLGTFQVPPALEVLAKKLKLGPAKNLLIRTPEKLQENLQEANWRLWPTQFGLPSPSQRFGKFVRAAGFEAIKYRSVKAPGNVCLAVFPCNIANDRSFIELVDQAPAEVTYRRLDLSSAQALCGWDYVLDRDRDLLRTDP